MIGMTWKGYIREQLFQHGYDLRRRHKDELGFDPQWDMARIAVQNGHAPVLFDVGANQGQTIRELRKRFRNPVIHAFEPSPTTFCTLIRQTVGTPNLYLRNFALGAHCEQRTLQENSVSVLTSLLPQGDACWGEIVNTAQVDVISLDSYCRKESIDRIEVLKSDTQGFDLEVLKGAVDLLAGHRIHQVFVELNFCELYKGLARFEDIYSFLCDWGFVPVAFYNQAVRDSRLGWADGLFVDPKFGA